MSSFENALKIANIHVKRLQYAIEKLKNSFPLDAASFENMPMERLLLIELLINRFSKLQDYMGTQIFTMLLAKVGEPVDEMTFIDKVNKLEKLNIIDSAEEWKEMRQLRNHLSHEYPDHPEITANYLNQTYLMTHKLIDCLKKVTEFGKKYP